MPILLSLLLLSAVSSPQDTKDRSAPDVQYAPAPGWVLPVPSPTLTPTPSEAPLRMVYYDVQDRVGPDGEDVFTAYRIKLLKPESLAAGNISITWSPSAGKATVHYIRIIRDNVPIDLLMTTRFRVIQRENGLEQSILDGLSTATMQAPGLQIGDEIEFAATIRRRDPTLGDHAFGFNQLPVQGILGAFRYRMLWPSNRKLIVKATADLSASAPTTVNTEKFVFYELRDPSSALVTEGAPPRYNVRRLVEYSDFATWHDVSKNLWPLYNRASAIDANSAIRAEAAKISAGNTSSVAKISAALRLVQDRIRYVYVGLNGGNYLPATAEETWQRRFGDCKAKTTLLLALLKALNIDAEAVLVNATGGGDGTNEHLPNPGLFDHILVRARADGKSYWIDGTRLGDGDLDALPPPAFRWALPLSQSGSDLLPVPAQPFDVPQFIGVIDVDATTGFDKPAKTIAQHIMRGTEAYQIRTQLAAMSTDDGNRAIKNYWRQQADWIEPNEVSWRYDERRMVLTLKVTGDGKPDWTGNDADGRSLTVYGAGFVPPDKMQRPKEQDQTAPWATEFPRYKCWATTIRLPTSTPEWLWSYSADAVSRTLGGVAYYRRAGLRNNVLRTLMSRQVIVPEISAAEAASVNAKIAGFNNNMSAVFQQAAKEGKSTSENKDLPFSDDVDWEGTADVCAWRSETSLK